MSLVSDKTESVTGSEFTAGSDFDRYRAEEEESSTSLALSTRAGSSLSTASTKIVRNTLGSSSSGHTSPIISPASSSTMSRNSLAASRLLRSRKDRGRGKATNTQLQLQTVPTGDDEQFNAASSPVMSPRSTSSASSMGPRRQAVQGRTRASPRNNKNLSQSSASTSIAASAATRRTLRNRALQRNRVAGGAAAKLLGPNKPPDAPNNVDNVVDNDDDDKDNPSDLPGEDPNLKFTSEEMHSIRQKAHHEFSVGSEANSRYHPKFLDDETKDQEYPEDEFLSEASLPSILNRSEVFHENATAAVVALLQPRKSGDANSVLSGGTATLDDIGIQVTPSTKGIMVTTEKPTGRAFQSPRTDKDNASIVSGMSNVVDTSFENVSKAATSPILNSTVEKKLEEIKRTMVNPSKTLADLLTNIATPEDPEDVDRGFMVRRKNACGAIKVLTVDARNRRTMCWTVGVLPALTSVLDDTGTEGLTAAYPDVHTRREYVEARKRAVASLLNLCTLKENRIPIFHSPGLLQAIVKVINDDKEESRQGCCAIVAFLAKTQENRLLMVQVQGLVDALNNVIKPMDSVRAKQPKAKKYTWDSDNDNSSAEGRNDSMLTENSDKFTLDTDSGRGTQDDDSDMTPQMTTSPANSTPRSHCGYDSHRSPHLRVARQNVFAMFLHAVKEKDNAFSLARHQPLVATLVAISKIHDSDSHVHAVKILAHLTRHRANSKLIVFQTQIVVPALVSATSSKNSETRRFACFGLQNLSQDKPCRQEVASTKGLVMALCQRARQSSDREEKLAAISALKNLTDDPANLIPMTNTPECFATLMQVAHGHDHSITEEMQYLACDALSTLSHWLRKIASSGNRSDLKVLKTKDMFVPTMKVVTWMQWH